MLDDQVDHDFIRRALAYANPNALRMAIYHETQDPELARIPVSQHALRGGALSTYVIPKGTHDLVREKAFDFLISGVALKDPPSLQQTKQLLTLFCGHSNSPSELQWAYEELGFDSLPRNAVWHEEPAKSKLQEFKVLIIGAGFSGLAMAIQLQRLGISFEILERHSDVGGTWHLNDYPEARVDVPSFSYQYKFEKDYQWQSFFASQPELLEYTNYIVDKYKLRQHIRLNTKLKHAEWSEAEKKWHLDIVNTEGETSLRANIVVSASGLFSTPKLPDIDGIETFEGAMFHTTDWDHTYSLKDKRAAIIGTGSTGTQLARHVAQLASHLTVFQRSANWVTPINGYHAKIPNELQWLMQVLPGYRAWFTYTNVASEYAAQDLHELDHKWIVNGGKINQKNDALRESLSQFIRKQTAAKPELYEKCLPRHAPMSRRLVIDNQWYETLVRDNVELITDEIEEITNTGIVDRTGKYHPLDVIILSAGFQVQRYFWPVEYIGRDSTSLEQQWAESGPRAFKGMTIPNLPNFFVIYGPNAQARAGSFHSVVEALSRYIASIIVHMLEHDQSTVEVKQEAFEQYNQALDNAHEELIWEYERGGGGYYVNPQGRAAILMPWRWHDFYEMIRTVDVANYHFS